jgi:zinc protease
MDYVLGGGSFSSRLMEEIRVRRGMAYAVQSIYRPRRGTGVFLAYAQTESGYTGEVLGLLVENIERMAREPIRHAELEWARGAIASSFVFRFDSPMKILSNRMEIVYNGLPENYNETYLERINGVDAKSILAESEELFAPGLVRLVVGHPSVAADLERFGEVVYLE